jgi:hypothetical protein
VQHFRRRAAGFLRAANDLDILDREAHAPAIGLLAVHGSIALADAVLAAVARDSPRAENHADAARRLRAWCSAKGLADGGVKHFEWLLGRKNHFSYDADPVHDVECWLAKTKMHQFVAWALRTFPQLSS